MEGPGLHAAYMERGWPGELGSANFLAGSADMVRVGGQRLACMVLGSGGGGTLSPVLFLVRV